MTDESHPNLRPDDASMRVAVLADRAADTFRGQPDFWTGPDGQPAASTDDDSYHEFIVALGGGCVAIRLTPDGTLTNSNGKIILLGGESNSYKICVERALEDILVR